MQTLSVCLSVHVDCIWSIGSIPAWFADPAFTRVSAKLMCLLLWSFTALVANICLFINM